MTADTLIAEYSRQPVVRSRNYSALLRWAAYITASPLPADKPSEADVRNRIVATRMPEQIDSYVQRTLAYFMQDPAITEVIHDWLNAFGDPDIEDQLSQRNSAIIGGFMPRFAETDVSDEQVQAFYAEYYPV